MPPKMKLFPFPGLLQIFFQGYSQCLLISKLFNLIRVYVLQGVRLFNRSQWRIQDFPEEGRQPQSGGTNLLFGQKFPENCMKMKEFGPRGGARVPGTPPPLRSANGSCEFSVAWQGDVGYRKFSVTE